MIKVKTIVGGRDLVGRNVVPQFGIVSRILGVPTEIFPIQLALDQLRLLSQEEDASLQTHFVRPFLDAFLKKRFDHIDVLC